MTTVLRDFLEIPYEQLEEMNLEVKQARINRETPDKLREARMKYLTDEKRIKAVTVCFTDLEGRLHMLDYDKKYLLKSQDNLTFDGSSVRGFSAQQESDLRLGIDWSRLLLAAGGRVRPRQGAGVLPRCWAATAQPYAGDLRSMLKKYSDAACSRRTGMVCHVAPEIEGFLFKGRDAERHYNETGKFEYVSIGGLLPLAAGRQAARLHRRRRRGAARDGLPEREGSPRGGAQPVRDELQLRRGAHHRRPGAALQAAVPPGGGQPRRAPPAFLPKPVTGVNGNGMHTNMSFNKGGKNLFWDAKGQENFSKAGWDAIDRILNNADDLCLVLNPSVNAYRRLDPHFEAPNQIKASANNRGAMVRIPTGNEKSAPPRGAQRGARHQPLPRLLLADAHRARGPRQRQLG